MEKMDIQSLDLEELTELIVSYGEKKFRAKQLFEWMHKKEVQSYNEMTNLPKQLIEKLKDQMPLSTLKEVNKLVDTKDGTVKYLFELEDGEIIETVLMKYKYGYSVCISSQVGCRMGCTFCASTLGGLIRNLRPSEMLNQIYIIENELEEPIHSVVVMGTGEPFDNYDAFKRFVELLSDEKGRNLSRRSITISTCGIPEKIIQTARELPQINLALSLHESNQAMRKQIMPIAARYELSTVIEACKTYIQMTNRRITFEYSLIQGKNDSVESARELVGLIKGMLCHVNLIPINPVDEKDQQATDEKDIERFKSILESYHIETTIRRSLGQEIEAACGQLRNRYKKREVL